MEVAELRQKLDGMDALQREVTMLRRQKRAAEEAAAQASSNQKAGPGVWNWLAPPPDARSGR